MCNSVLQSDHIVACFDESLNEVVQKVQMDLCVYYWDVNKSRTATRYFDSSFLGHTTANNLQSSFTSLLNDQILLKIVQVSIDGPNVKLKFLDQLIDQLEIQSEKSVLDMQAFIQALLSTAVFSSKIEFFYCLLSQ